MHSGKRDSFSVNAESALEILEWLGDAVLSSDRAEQAARAEMIKKLKTHYEQLKARIETMYTDKLDGRITQEFFDRQAATLRRQQDGLLHKDRTVHIIFLLTSP